MESPEQVVETPKQELTEEQEVLKAYQDSLNDFIIKVSNYQGSKSQLQRVLINAAVHPMNKEELHFSFPEEKELFDVFENLSAAKFFLMVASLENEGRIVFVEKEEPTNIKLDLTIPEGVESLDNIRREGTYE